MTNAEVIGVEGGDNKTDSRQVVMLKDGERIDADVVVGADGLLNNLCYALKLKLT